MPLLNSDPSAVYLGATAVSAIYQGAAKVYPPAVSDPASVSGLVRWFRADDIAAADGTAVASWSDRVITTDAAVQATSTKQPLLKTNIVGGHSVVRFDGADDVLLPPSTTFPADFSVVVVARSNAAIANGNIGPIGADGGTIRTFLLRYNAAPSIGFTSYATDGTTTVSGPPAGTVTATNWHAIYATRTGATNGVQVFWNNTGGSVTTGSVAGRNGATTWSIGKPDLYGTVNNFNGDIAEVMVYGKILTTADRTTLNSYISSRYGITMAP